MCKTIWVPCNEDHNSDSNSPGLLVLVDLAASLWRTGKRAWWLVSNFALGLYVIATWLYRATRWTVHAIQRGYRWYATRPVVLDRQPVAAVTATTTLPTLRDLMQKQEANAR